MEILKQKDLEMVIRRGIKKETQRVTLMKNPHQKFSIN